MSHPQHILLADDDEDNRALFSLYLDRLGVPYALAENGAEAVQLAQETAFDLILMDIDMPILDGLQAMKAIRQAGYAGPILALTGHSEADMIERCRVAGANASLSKPINKAEFLQTIQTYLKSSTEDDSPMVSQLLRNKANPKMLKLVKKFVRSLPDKMQAIDGALQTQDWDTLKSQMHQMKGVSGNFGFHDMAEQFEAMEEQVALSSVSGFTAQLATLKTMVTRAERGMTETP